MNPQVRRFVTGVEASNAILPAKPEMWSYSSLKAIETCPKQYMLTRAAYPEYWGGMGYPRLPTIRALIGDVVHDSLETIVKALGSAGCESPSAPGVVALLESLGGLTAVVERAAEERLRRLDGNPRIDREYRRRLERELQKCVAGARFQLQEYLSRATFAMASHPRSSVVQTAPVPVTRGRIPARRGANPELLLEDKNLRLMGKADRIDLDGESARIVDYKTGREDPAHLEQLQLYALLWDLDRDVNPDAVPMTELVVAYPNRDEVILAPSQEELRALEESIRCRIAAADALIDEDVPDARPERELCRSCSVRHLCDHYWGAFEQDLTDLHDGDWFDYQGVVGPANAGRSRWMLNPTSGRQELLLRTTATPKPIPEGTRVRILGLQLVIDPDADVTTARVANSSEVFAMTSTPD